MIKRILNPLSQCPAQSLLVSRWASAAAAKKPRAIKTPAQPKELKPSKPVQQYFEQENPDVFEQFPVKLLRNKHRTPDSFYVAHKNAVKTIAQQLSPKLEVNGHQVPLIEVNPGPGLLTKKLLKKGFKNLLLFEANDAFSLQLETIVAANPSSVALTRADFLNLWKLVFQDKLDNGDRAERLLHQVPKHRWDDGVCAQIFASIGNINFFKHLINSIVFQNSLLSHGRCEMVLCLPPPLYIHLTCTNEAGYMLYRATSMLFQIMFEHEFIGKIPREYFLPWQLAPDLRTSSKLAKIKAIDHEFLYLVRMRPRKELYELCQAENMQALWYFVKQHTVSRKNRIIPMLEHWIPGCGVRLITNSQAPVKPQPLIENAKTQQPPLCTAATTMSTQDFLPNINIFTQFGDVSPSQMLTLFDQFRQWPEYTQQCSFVSAMESNFIKMDASVDQNVEGIQDEDDAGDGQADKKAE